MNNSHCNDLSNSLNKSKNKRALEYINIFSISVFILWYITPYFQAIMYGRFSNIVVLGLLSIWGVTSFLINPKWLAKMPVHLLLVSIMLCSFFIITIINFKGNPRSFFMIGTSFWLPLYIFHFYKTSHLQKYLRTLANLVIGILCITAITTIYGLYLVPNAVRILTDARSDFSQDLLLMKYNIGGFDFVYGIILLVPILFISGKKYNLVRLVGLILISLVVLKSSFAIGLILLLTSYIMSVFPKKYKNLNIIMLVFLLIIIAITPNNFYSAFIIKIADGVNNITISTRLYELANFFASGNVENTINLSARLNLYKVSVNTFIQNPFVGIGPYYYVQNVGIGYHSQILDDLARYGIFAFSFILMFFYHYHSYVVKIWERCAITANISVVFFLFFISSMLNLTFSQPTISIIVFLLVPAIPYIFKNDLLDK